MTFQYPISPASLALSLPESNPGTFYTGGAPGYPYRDNEKELDAIYRDALQNANVSTIVPFPIKDEYWHLRVNVTESRDTRQHDINHRELEDPHSTLRSWELQWPGDTTFNEALARAEDIQPSDTRLALLMFDRIFPESVKERYDFNAPGDCTPVLGPACMRMLETQRFSTDDPYQQLMWPNACVEATGGHGPVFSGELEKSPERTPPVIGGFGSTAHEVGDQTSFKVEAEGLEIILLTGHRVYPICVRAKKDD